MTADRRHRQPSAPGKDPSLVRPRLLLVLAVLAVLGLVAAAVVAGTEGPDTPAASGSASGTAAEAPPLPRAVGRYVALGDSYTAGPLIHWVHNDPPGCLRSTRNYPALLAQWLDVKDFVDVSCSGATTADMTRSPDSFGQRVPPQLAVVTADTDLVTVGIGGNDFDVFSTLASGERPAGILATLERTGRRVADVVAQVQDNAPEAVVAIVGYPHIVPDHGSCPALPFDGGDNRYLNRVERTLNRQLSQAAAEQDALFVDTYGPSHGHDACAGERAWVNGSRTIPLRALALHPFESGMQATATALHEALRGEPPTPATRRRAAAALAPRPADAFSLRGQRLAASVLGG